MLCTHFLCPRVTNQCYWLDTSTQMITEFLLQNKERMKVQRVCISSESQRLARQWKPFNCTKATFWSLHCSQPTLAALRYCAGRHILHSTSWNVGDTMVTREGCHLLLGEFLKGNGSRSNGLGALLGAVYRYTDIGMLLQVTNENWCEMYIGLVLIKDPGRRV